MIVALIVVIVIVTLNSYAVVGDEMVDNDGGNTLRKILKKHASMLTLQCSKCQHEKWCDLGSFYFTYDTQSCIYITGFYV